MVVYMQQSIIENIVDLELRAITTRGVHWNSKTDPLAQTTQTDPIFGQPGASDGRRRVSATKNRFRQVGWRVLFFNT